MALPRAPRFQDDAFPDKVVAGNGRAPGDLSADIVLVLSEEGGTTQVIGYPQHRPEILRLFETRLDDIVSIRYLSPDLERVHPELFQSIAAR